MIVSVYVHPCALVNYPRPTAEELKNRGSMSDFNYPDIWCMTNTANCASSAASLNNTEDKFMIQKPPSRRLKVFNVICA